MLPKKFRLHDYQEVEKVKKEGKLYQSPLFGLLVLEKPGQATSRFSFIVSTKLSKKAVQRNHLKRLLSEAVRGLLPKVKPGFDLVFLGKKSLIGKSLSEIQIEVNNIFCKSGLMIVE